MFMAFWVCVSKYCAAYQITHTINAKHLVSRQLGVIWEYPPSQDCFFLSTPLTNRVHASDSCTMHSNSNVAAAFFFLHGTKASRYNRRDYSCSSSSEIYRHCLRQAFISIPLGAITVMDEQPISSPACWMCHGQATFMHWRHDVSVAYLIGHLHDTACQWHIKWAAMIENCFSWVISTFSSTNIQKPLRTIRTTGSMHLYKNSQNHFRVP